MGKNEQKKLINNARKLRFSEMCQFDFAKKMAASVAAK